MKLHSLLAFAFVALSLNAAFAEPVVFESAETPATLIELFSSEGCSSCPPAEAWISGLKTRQDLWKSIVPVVFHVNYWDNLGWPDRFASSAFTERQRRYASLWRTDSLYTPGFVVDGREWHGWFDHEPLRAPKAEKVGALRVTLDEHRHVEVSFAPMGTLPKSLQVHVALMGMDITSQVKRGENGGRHLAHDFIALTLTSARMAHERGLLTATLSLPENTIAQPAAVAAWVVDEDSQTPIQAVGGWLTKGSY